MLSSDKQPKCSIRVSEVWHPSISRVGRGRCSLHSSSSSDEYQCGYTATDPDPLSSTQSHRTYADRQMWRCHEDCKEGCPRLRHNCRVRRSGVRTTETTYSA